MHRTICALIIWSVAPTTLLGQSGADRVAVDSVLSAVATATDLAHLPATTGCAARSSGLGALCTALITLRRAEVGGSERDAAHTGDLLESVVTRHPDWAVAWYALGAARLRADAAGLGTHVGPLQDDQISNAAGAERAFLWAFHLDSNFTLAAEALALSPIVRDGSSRLPERVLALRHARHLLPPPFLFAAALVEREAGQLDSAIALEVGLLKSHAAPRGLVDLTLAHDLFRAKRPDAAMPVYFAGANDTAAVSREAYGNDLAWIASSDEMAQWNALAPELRPAWLRHFWAVRDLADGRPAGARLAEHNLRLDEVFARYRFRYVNRANRNSLTRTGRVEYFTTAIAGTAQPFTSIGSFDDLIDDRGRAYLRQGFPHLAMQTRDDAGFELWQYQEAGRDLFLSFSPKQLVRPHAGPWAVSVLRTLDQDTVFAAPAMLVPTVASPVVNMYGYKAAGFCALKPSLCAAFPDSSHYTTPGINCSPAAVTPDISWRLGDQRFIGRDSGETHGYVSFALTRRDSVPPGDAPYIFEREREEGFWSIDHAMGTDAFPVPFTRQLSASFDAHILRGIDGKSYLVVAFSIPATDLPPPDFDVQRDSLVYPTRVHLAALRDSDGLRLDVDTIANLTAPRAVTRHDPLVGILSMPLPPGRYHGAVWIQQLGDQSGVLVKLDSLTVPPISGGLQVSDVVLSSEQSRVHWTAGEGSIPFDPAIHFRRGMKVEAYFGLSGLTAGKAYGMRIELFRELAPASQQPVLSIASTETPNSDHLLAHRSLGIDALELGRYTLRVTLNDGATRASASGCLRVVK